MANLRAVGDIYELESLDAIRNDPAYNDGIAPTRKCDRTWNKWHVAALWVGMAICVPTYVLGGILTAYFGLSVVEALWTILIANTILLIPLTLNAVAGTKYGIPFPVLLRSSFGVFGSNLPILMRALVACGWFGIQTLFGGLAVDILFDNLIPGWEALGRLGYVISFFIFWILNTWVVIRGFKPIKTLESFAAPLLLIIGMILLLWGWRNADMSAVFSTPANRPEGASFWGCFFGSLTAMVGFWATLALNIPDLSRFVQSQKDQIVGQIIGLPLTMFLFSALGVIMTAAASQIFGETISDPITLIGRMGSDLFIIVAMVVIIFATIATNTAANIISPTKDLQNMMPQIINMKRGVWLTGIIGVILVSWELLRRSAWLQTNLSMESIYTNWLLTYSSLLGPIAGVMIADFFFVRERQLDVESLYKQDGPFGGINFAGVLAFVIPALLALIGLSQGSEGFLWPLYNYGWFTGAILGLLLYQIFAYWGWARGCQLNLV